MYVHIYIYIYIYICIRVYVYMYVYVYICINTQSRRHSSRTLHSAHPLYPPLPHPSYNRLQNDVLRLQRLHRTQYCNSQDRRTAGCNTRTRPFTHQMSNAILLHLKLDRALAGNDDR